MKTFFFHTSAGIGMGAVLMLIVTNSIYLSGNEKLDGALFLKNSIGMILSGWLFAVTPLIFKVERIKLSQQTIIHFSIVAAFYFIIAGWIGWFSLTPKSIALFASMFIFIYAVIWLGFYLYFRRVARDLNDSLNLQ